MPSPVPVPSDPECINLNSCTYVDTNTIVFGDFITSSLGGSDTAGRLFIGGNAELFSYSVGAGLAQSNGDRDDLIVAGTLDFESGTVANGNIVHGPGATIGSSVEHSMTFNSIVENPNGFNFGTAKTCFSTMSHDLLVARSGGGHVEKKEVTGNANLWFYKDEDPNPDNLFDVYTVYCVDVTDDITMFNFDNVPQQHTTVINMIGEECKLNVAVAHDNPRRVIWNFPDANKLTIGNLIEGSILAPFAAINATGMINGQVIAGSWYGAGQQNHYPFNGCLPRTLSSANTYL
jgi:choice-of-anchor A domain-containing protein